MIINLDLRISFVEFIKDLYWAPFFSLCILMTLQKKKRKLFGVHFTTILYSSEHILNDVSVINKELLEVSNIGLRQINCL